MRLISMNELKKINENNKDKAMDDIIIANLCYHLLNGNIEFKDLKDFSQDVIMYISHVINGNERPKLLTQIVMEELLDSSMYFSLEEFIKKPDCIRNFKLKCNYNRLIWKSALGYILPDKAIYCDTYGNTHASLVTTYHRREDPNFEDLALWHVFHPDQPDWHKPIMAEKQAIIIHFMPNEFGEVIYIPNTLTEFQYNELTKINDILLQNEIEAETNYEGMNLATALAQQDFREKHGLPRTVISESIEVKV